MKMAGEKARERAESSDPRASGLPGLKKTAIQFSS